jgi:hypothetical protein
VKARRLLTALNLPRLCFLTTADAGRLLVSAVPIGSKLITAPMRAAQGYDGMHLLHLHITLTVMADSALKIRSR